MVLSHSFYSESDNVCFYFHLRICKPASTRRHEKIAKLPNLKHLHKCCVPASFGDAFRSKITYFALGASQAAPASHVKHKLSAQRRLRTKISCRPASWPPRYHLKVGARCALGPESTNTDTENASNFQFKPFCGAILRDTATGPLIHLAHYFRLSLFCTLRKDVREVIFEAKKEVGSAPNFLRINSDITVSGSLGTASQSASM